MSKITLQSVASIDNSLIAAVNNNNAILTSAVDNTLSRDGTSPNPMTSILDMNNHQIINIPFASTPNQPVALGQITPGSTANGIVATGDATGSSNAGIIPLTLATVNSNVGTFGDSTHTPIITVNGKGLITAASSVVSSGGGGGASSGNLTLLNTLTASGSASLSDTTSFTTTYPEYRLFFSNLIPATSAVNMLLQVHVSGTGFSATNYTSKEILLITSTSFFSSATSILIGTNLTNTVPGVCGHISFYNPAVSAVRQAFDGIFSVTTATSVGGGTFIAGIWGDGSTSSIVDGFQVTCSSGNITSGTIKVYGVNA